MDIEEFDDFYESPGLPKESKEMSQDLKDALLYEIYKDDIEEYYFNKDLIINGEKYEQI